MNLFTSIATRQDDLYPNTEAKRKRAEACKQVGKLLTQALDNTARMSADKSRLRALTLHSNVSLDDIGPLLSHGDRFPHLEQLDIHHKYPLWDFGEPTSRNNFQVITIMFNVMWVVVHLCSSFFLYLDCKSCSTANMFRAQVRGAVMLGVIFH